MLRFIRILSKIVKTSTNLMTKRYVKFVIFGDELISVIILDRHMRMKVPVPSLGSFQFVGLRPPGTTMGTFARASFSRIPDFRESSSRNYA